ncbi:uncharacterized protein LOC135181251 [Pogoniulus pusillus]|uniref:uncharacterized protein LOC135181251 n=1 Tax=Pogoniulus pusillus TaxID=488313 RepID=UPI0030B95EA0
MHQQISASAATDRRHVLEPLAAPRKDLDWCRLRELEASHGLMHQRKRQQRVVAVSGTLIALPQIQLQICIQPQPQTLAEWDALVPERGAVVSAIPHCKWFRNGFPLENGGRNVSVHTLRGQVPGLQCCSNGLWWLQAAAARGAQDSACGRVGSSPGCLQGFGRSAEQARAGLKPCHGEAQAPQQCLHFSSCPSELSTASAQSSGACLLGSAGGQASLLCVHGPHASTLQSELTVCTGGGVLEWDQLRALQGLHFAFHSTGQASQMCSSSRMGTRAPAAAVNPSARTLVPLQPGPAAWQGDLLWLGSCGLQSSSPWVLFLLQNKEGATPSSRMCHMCPSFLLKELLERGQCQPCSNLLSSGCGAAAE